MPNPVSIEDRRKRNKMLTILSEKKRRFFYENHLNEVRPVLFEKAKERGLMSGFTDNYIKVEVPIKESFLNQIRPVKLLEIGDNGQVKIELKEVTEMVG
jgi:threonylcarbamoyladenosine tRNA methylthiotransferase MtaB